MNKDFFNRNAEIVARELLGKIFVRKINDGRIKKLKAKIVETEAYFNEKDPASRARQKGDLRDTMKMCPGTILVYGVHASWLMNIVIDEEGRASAVLIRALEPLNFSERCGGPGLLTRALKIGKEFHKRNILNDKEVWVEEFGNSRQNKKYKSLARANGPSSYVFKDTNKKNNNFKIIKSFRIGVKEDLSRKLRFYIKNSPYISKL